MGLFLMAGCVTNQYPFPAQTGVNDRLVGVGYAVINAQPGNTPEEKRLMEKKSRLKSKNIIFSLFNNTLFLIKFNFSKIKI